MVLKSLRDERILRRGLEVVEGSDLIQNMWNKREKVKNKKQRRVIETSFC